MAVKKDRKISLVVMVITRKYYIYYSWPPATRNKCNIFLVMTITTCDILRSFFTAIKDSPNDAFLSFVIMKLNWSIFEHYLYRFFGVFYLWKKLWRTMLSNTKMLHLLKLS